MKKLLIILLLAGTAQGETILVPDYAGTFQAEYAAAIAPTPIAIDRIVFDRIGIDDLTIFSFKEIVELGTYLQDAVTSVQLEHAIKQRDWAAVSAIVGAEIARKIRYAIEGGIYPKVATSFFIAIGEVRSVKEAELALSIRGLDSFLVPVYDPSARTTNDILDYAMKQKAKVIPAIDYPYCRL